MEFSCTLMVQLSPGLWGRLEVDLKQRERDLYSRPASYHLVTLLPQKSAFPSGKTMIFLKRGLPGVSQPFYEFIKFNTSYFIDFSSKAHVLLSKSNIKSSFHIATRLLNNLKVMKIINLFFF